MTQRTFPRRPLRFMVAAGVVLGASLDVLSHGGIGIPQLSIQHPGVGVILDVGDAGALVRWEDSDPDDNANLALALSPNLQDGVGAIPIIAGLPEDCDPQDGGPVFTGVVDGGDPAALSRAQCGPVTSDCTALNDCYRLGGAGLPTGVYWVFGALDDDRGDGIPPDVVYAQSAGVVRVTNPGDNVPPVVLLLEPDGVGDVVDTCFHVRWVMDDPDDNATLELWLQRVDGVMEQLPQSPVARDDGVTGMDVDLSAVPDLTQWRVFARVDDGHRAPLQVQSPGLITRYVGRGQDGGCTARPPVDDGGPGVDAAAEPDAAMQDAGGGDGDAAPPADAAVTSGDAAVAPDSAVPDAAGLEDGGAGGGGDAGQPDPPVRCGGNHVARPGGPCGALTAAQLMVMVRARRRAWRSMKLG